jgi:hypothetical protein
MRNWKKGYPFFLENLFQTALGILKYSKTESLKKAQHDNIENVQPRFD